MMAEREKREEEEKRNDRPLQSINNAWCRRRRRRRRLPERKERQADRQRERKCVTLPTMIFMLIHRIHSFDYVDDEEKGKEKSVCHSFIQAARTYVRSFVSKFAFIMSFS